VLWLVSKCHFSKPHRLEPCLFIHSLTPRPMTLAGSNPNVYYKHVVGLSSGLIAFLMSVCCQCCERHEALIIQIVRIQTLHHGVRVSLWSRSKVPGRLFSPSFSRHNSTASAFHQSPSSCHPMLPSEHLWL